MKKIESAVGKDTRLLLLEVAEKVNEIIAHISPEKKTVAEKVNADDKK